MSRRQGFPCLTPDQSPCRRRIETSAATAMAARALPRREDAHGIVAARDSNGLLF
ncbi:hypothetical protein [Ensifer sp. MJa1]|uniref:hypothetical protein n=1 Tax=Ensifer sp. MJa1 TaxID=2919888 RepID=UPI00300B59D8